MANDQQQGGPLIGLVEVVFVGGPFHARRMFMARPEFRMELEQESGERTVYSRRVVEAEVRDGSYMNIATYAPVGISEDELARLRVDAARLRYPLMNRFDMRPSLTPAQRGMLLELADCGEAAMSDGVIVHGGSRGVAGRLEEMGFVTIKVVGTPDQWEARALLTNAGRKHLGL